MKVRPLREFLNGGVVLMEPLGVTRKAQKPASKKEPIILWFTCLGMTPRPLRLGQADACREKLSGNTPRRAERRMRSIPGVMKTRPSPTHPATFGRGISLPRTLSQTVTYQLA